MPHYFIESGMRNADEVCIEGALQQHLAGALRVRVGEEVTLVDGAQALRAKITEVARRRLRLTVLDSTDLIPDPVRVTLAVGTSKGRKLEAITKHAVALGAHHIQPVITARSVARGQGDSRVDRLSAIALEAAQQSARARVPTVAAPVPLSDFLATPLVGQGVVLWEREDRLPLRTLLSPLPQQLTLFIGPEGGLTADEVAALCTHGFACATLGRHVLRTETACLAALALVMGHSA